MVQKEVFFLRVSENEAGVCSEKLFGNKRALREFHSEIMLEGEIQHTENVLAVLPQRPISLPGT